MNKAFPIEGLSSVGVVKDIPNYTIPSEGWTDASNIRLSSKGISRIGGHAEALSGVLGVPQFILSVPALNDTAWIYCSSTRAYVSISGVHTEITRKSGASIVPYLTLTPHDWEGVLLGGIPILNNKADVPQWWSAVDGSVVLANLPHWPANTTAKAVVSFGSYLFALNVTENGTKRPHVVWWSHKADPGTIPSSWDYADPTVDAARFELTDTLGGEIVDGLLLGDALIVYKQSSTHSIRFIGGQYLFSPTQILSSSGLLCNKCVTAFNNGTQHFVVTDNDIIVHSGTREATPIVDGVVRKFLFDDMDSNNYVNSFVFDNPTYKEVWFCYPEGGAVYPTKAAIWGYGKSNKGWTFRSFDGCCADRGRYVNIPAQAWNDDATGWDTDNSVWTDPGVNRVLFGNNNLNKIFVLDEGVLFNGQLPAAFVERTGLAMTGKDRKGNAVVNIYSVKLLTRIWVKATGVWNVTFGAQDSVEGEVFWNTPKSFDSSIDKFVDDEVSGPLLAVKFELVSQTGLLSGYEVEFMELGNI